MERIFGLEHLYMSDCAISKIEAGAFVDLVHLRWLDLSDNRLTTLSDGTFAGLHLHQLFLNGNHRLVLDGGRPFANLTVFGLYLHDCRLTRIDAGTVASLDGSLRVLWLSENRLSRLDSALGRLFASLDHFRLADNRLHCNCELSWLWRLHDEYRRRRNENPMSEEAPECVSPTSLRGQNFDELRQDDLRCQAPTLADIEVTLIDDDDDVGQSSGHRRLLLRCTATGDPTPNVYWIRTSTTASLPPTTSSMIRKDSTDDVGEALLVLNDDDVQSTSPEHRSFTCVASNVVGEVTLTVRRVLRTLKVAADIENDEAAPRYTYINGDVAEMSAVNDRRLLIQRNRFSAKMSTESVDRSRFACSVLSENRANSSSGELCGGRDRRLRASDGHSDQSFAESDDTRQFRLAHLLTAVMLTVLLTATSVVGVVAVCLRHHSRSTSAQPQQPRTTTDNASRQTVSATALVYDTVAHLTRKSLSSIT